MKPRIIYAFITAFLVFTACGDKKPVDELPPPGPVKPVIPPSVDPSAGATVFGAVRDDKGAPVPGAVVSDGYICTQTGEDGTYALKSALKDVTFVWVCAPSGYTAPHTNGLPRFFQRLDALKPNSDGIYDSVDFELLKMADPDRFTVFMVADPQPRVSSAGYDKIGYHSLDCVSDMFRDLQEAAASRADHHVTGIVLGDVCHNDCNLFSTYTGKMKNIGFPLYHVIGNHDHNLKVAGDVQSGKYFESVFGPTNYSFNLGDCHFIIIDNMMAKSGSRDTNSGANLCSAIRDDIYQWMVNDLSFVDRSKTIMLCSHGPMFHTMGGGYQTRGKFTFDGKTITNHYADVDTLIAKYPKVHAWAGHIHRTYNHVDKLRPRVETHTLVRVCGQLWTNEWEDGGTPRGYTVVDCEGGKLSWKFHANKYQSGTCQLSRKPSYTYRDWDYVGGVAKFRSDSSRELDESYQMHIYAPGSYADGDNLIYANVFLWDELWDTPTFTVNGSTTSMTRMGAAGKYTIGDRASGEINAWYKQYNSTLASGDYSADADECCTMFSAPCGATHGTGTVSVKDRFGNTYRQSITW